MDDARDIIDQTVLVRLKDYEGLEFTGIEGDGPFFCRVTAVDEIGMWVENRHFITIELRDSEGRDIPVKDRKEVENRVVFLLPWRNVLTVVRFEEFDEEMLLGGIGEEGAESGRIGFIK